MAKENFFTPENEIAEKKSVISSPFGRYRLEVTPYKTQPGAWNYSRGVVFATVNAEPIANIQRNYGSFFHAFIENHPNGHDYLIGGEDYQGQTVVELDTGKRVDHLPAEAKDGIAFCWVAATFYPSTQILVVEGCHWACPFEFRFYDFSDPMSGWPEIKPEEFIASDEQAPTLHLDGTITCYQTEEGEVAATKTFRRSGLELILEREYVTKKEKARREEEEKARHKYEAWVKNFRTHDPLYLVMRNTIESDPAFVFASEFDGFGTTYDGWCPDWKGSERLVNRRIAKPEKPEKEGKGVTIDIEWATETGPIKLLVYRNGKKTEDAFFHAHTEDSMRQALSWAKAILK